MPPSVLKLLEGLDFRGGQRPNDGRNDLTEAGQDTGIDGVGFGQDAQSFREVADLPSVDHHGRQRSGEQGADGSFLIMSGRLEDDAFGTEGARPGDEFGDAGRVVGEAPPLGGRKRVGVEEILADIDAENTFHRKLPGMRSSKAGGTEGVTCSGW